MKRVWGLLATGLLLAGPAHAETWKSGITLVRERSVQLCKEWPDQVWDLTLNGGTFSGANNHGAKFSTPVAPDGSVKTSYMGNIGRDQYQVELTGNVKTRELELLNVKYACRYKLVPK